VGTTGAYNFYSMKIIKRTTSLSTLTGRKVEAVIYLDNGSVYLEKSDEKGRVCKNIIEKDYNLYKNLSSLKLKSQSPASTIQIYASGSCNLNCKLCYSPDEDAALDMKPEKLEGILSGIENKNVILGGREPSCNKNLAELISVVSKRNRPLLLTNGIKLAEREYLLSLKRAGLKGILFSFNGFSDSVYEKINGGALLSQKLKALDNIRRLKIPVEISTTVMRGVNESQIGEILKYCFDNLSWIKAFRIRSMSPSGRYPEKDYFTLSELLGILSEASGIKVDELKKCGQFINTIGVIFKIPHLFPRVCSTSIFIRKAHRYIPVACKMDFDGIEKTKFKKLKLFVHTVRELGLIYSLCTARWPVSIYARLRNFAARRNGILEIQLRSWPNIYNLDLEENRKCTDHYRLDSGIEMPFCYYNIVKSNKFDSVTGEPRKI